MDNRQEKLLTMVVETYVQTAEPVSSGYLVEAHPLGVSSATIRSEMNMLEEEGFLTHPHTSAGRIPTEKGYTYYVEYLMGSTKIKKSEQEALEEILEEEIGEPKMKNLAKRIAQFSEEAVIVAFTDQKVYYTGISHLFSKPEFAPYHELYTLSAMFDHVDEVIGEVFCSLKSGVTMFIGSKNPLGEACSLVALPFRHYTKEKSMIGILGPLRMDYPHAIGLVEVVEEHI